MNINMHYQNRALCVVSATLGNGHKTLGKAFAECDTRQRSLSYGRTGKAYFAECQNRVLGKKKRTYDAETGPVAPHVHTLPSADNNDIRQTTLGKTWALGAGGFAGNVPTCPLFIECPEFDTRQRYVECSYQRHSAKVCQNTPVAATCTRQTCTIVFFCLHPANSPAIQIFTTFEIFILAHQY